LSQNRYHGWLLLAHPEFEDRLSIWRNEVATLAAKSPETYRSHQKTKRLANLEKLVFEVIPTDPADSRWLLGNTLGDTHRAWRRAKFMQQYRLFFRFDSKAKIIIFAWVKQ
jgi:toxin YhaV